MIKNKNNKNLTKEHTGIILRASIVLSVEKKSNKTELSSKNLKGILTKMWILPSLSMLYSIEVK